MNLIKKYKEIVIKTTVILFVSLLLYFLFGNSIYLQNGLVSGLIVFLSITFGFYITSFSIFTTSKYVAKLYQIDDDKKYRKQSLMHTLIDKYKIGLISTLISIFYILIIFFIFDGNKQVKLDSNSYFTFLIFVMLFNFYYAFEMMNILIKVIQQTVKLNKQSD